MLRRLSKGLSVECDAFVAIDAVYRPCNPEENPLYGVIAGHLETFLARQRERDRNVPGFVEKMWSSTARQRFRKQNFDRRCMLNLSDSCEDPGAVPNLKEKPMGFPGLRGRWTCRSNSRVPTKR